MADLTEGQFWVGGIGLALLAFTLYLNARATNAAIEANKISRESAERQSRAYVAQHEVGGHAISESVHEFRVELKNFGATPARHVRSEISWGYFQSELPKDFDYPLKEGTPGSETGYIGPGGHIAAHAQIDNETLIKAARNELVPFIWSWVEYDDVFPNTPRRRTEYCFRIEVGGTPEKTLIGLSTIGPHNGADEDCYRKPQT